DVGERIVYRWPNSGRAGSIIMRQYGGRRRWDVLPNGHQSSALGELQIESAAEADPTPVPCSWIRKSTGDEVDIRCGNAVLIAPFGWFLYEALNRHLIQPTADQTIAGQQATCYDYASGQPGGVVCFEAASGPLLLLDTGVVGQR